MCGSNHVIVSYDKLSIGYVLLRIHNYVCYVVWSHYNKVCVVVSDIGVHVGMCYCGIPLVCVVLVSPCPCGRHGYGIPWVCGVLISYGRASLGMCCSVLHVGDLGLVN